MKKVLFDILKLERDLQDIVQGGVLSIPPKIEYGHLSFNGLIRNREKEEHLINFLSSMDFIEKYEILPSKFCNIWIRRDIEILYSLDLGNQRTVHLEYCSPNPTGDIHIGHFRNIVIGLSVSNLLRKTGWNVFTENYINDQGVQIDECFETVMHYITGNSKYNIFYKGDYIKSIAQELGESDNISKESLIEILLNKINRTLKFLNINFDSTLRESSLQREIKEVHRILEEKDLLYKGQLLNQKTEGENIILKTSIMGMKEDCVFQKNNGNYTYFAYDIAYYYSKLHRGFKNQICVVSEDHLYHVEKLNTVIKYVFGNSIKFISYAMVELIENGDKKILSKRLGNTFSMEELSNVMTFESAKSLFLSYHFNKVIHFDIEKKISHFILTCKYFLQKEDRFTEDGKGISEELFRKVIFWPIIVKNAQNQLNTHKIIDYIKDLVLLLEKFKDSKLSLDDRYIWVKLKDILQFVFDIIN